MIFSCVRVCVCLQTGEICSFFLCSHVISIFMRVLNLCVFVFASMKLCACMLTSLCVCALVSVCMCGVSSKERQVVDSH